MTSVPQTPKRAVLYERVSTEEQAKHGYSIGDQLDTLRKYARERGYEIVGEFSDPGDTGLFMERPGLDRLRQFVAAGGADLVLARDADRITREPIHRALLDAEFEGHGVRLVALDDWGDDTHEGALLKYLKGWVSRGESLKIAERTHRGRLAKARRGGLKIGRIPKYGYMPNEDRTSYLVDPETMPIVERIIRSVAAGHSLHGLKKALEAEGVSTPHGSKVWNRTFIRKRILDDAYLPHSYTELEELVAPEVLRTLDPEAHYGVIWHNRHVVKVVDKVKTPDGYKVRRKFSERPREEWIAVPIPAPPNLDRETVMRARAQIAGNVRPPSRGLRVWELSGGLLYCGHCGARMHGHNSPSRGRPLFYYICPLKINEYYAACENPSHRAEPLEELVAQSVAQVLSDPTGLIERIDQRIAEETAIARDPKRELATLGHKLEELGAMRERYLKLYARGTITSEAELEKMLSELETERESLERAIEAARGRKRPPGQRREVARTKAYRTSPV